MKTTNNADHIGRKISRIRELRGMKQEALAMELGVSQQTVSNIEKSAAIETDLLAQVAKILGVTPEAVEKFNEEMVFNYFNTFNDNSASNANINLSGCTFNPLEKLLEV